MPLFNDRFIESIVILTGAGVSAESGIATFRDADGLWEKHDPMEIATPEAFTRDPALVYRFYNARRRQLADVQPNAAHQALARLQQRTMKLSVTISEDSAYFATELGECEVAWVALE